ncbi:AMP-dependent synthetase/ligase [Yinghuangia seranimata]|uniref:AMP-dependent synthetase/ligase n=1 Tax=Yinghuangia seranimata TaxID=408067 RepID=UPI00248C9DAB|nr:AMP-dependent synthetase/ligase [Yinghuangia seranimata]MDI2126119.1 AMP-dependent synthetase/ligase [Yinghuangia seranimata]
MREFSVPALAEVPAEGNLTDIIRTNATEAPHAPVLSRKVDGRWRDVTSAEFLVEVYAAAKGLIASGVGPGDRVGLMSRTRYEWCLFDFAIWCAGAVTVPIYETSSAEQVEWILNDSEATAVIVESAAHEAILESVRGNLSELKHVWRIEQGESADDGTAEAVLAAAGAALPDSAVEERCATLTGESIATLIYTSGTTGRPKGCVLTHSNFFVPTTNLIALLEDLFSVKDPSCLLFLPLAHVLGRELHVICMQARVRTGHCPDIRQLTAELAEFKPTFVLAVPRVFEKVYNTATAKAEADGKGKIFKAAADTAIAYSEALDAGGPGLVLKAKHALFDKLVYGKLRAALGGRCEFSVSGGAPLGARLGHFYRGIGLTILEGYGLTESTAATALNPTKAVGIGSVGVPIPGSAIRIADDGEILLKGANVFQGYWKNDAATADAFEDGWFRTGDLGQLSDKGYLTVTGRKKEILVTAGGKNVAPAVIEDRIRAHSLISECMVVGDARPFVAALVTIDPETFPRWKEQHGKPADATVADLVDDPDLNASVQEAIDEGNKAVSKAEGVKKFRILTINFSEESGHLTPSLKLKRNLVMKDFAGDVENIYAG